MESRTNKIDIWILIPVLALIAYSLAVVYSASSSWSAKMNGDSSYLFKHHLVRAIIGIAMLFIFARIDYRNLISFRKFLFALAVIMLLFLLVAGVETTKGATRWIKVGGFSFQPADFVKYTLMINLAYLLAKKKEYIDNLYYGYLPLLIYVVLIVSLIAVQPNFSTASTIFISSMMLFYVGKVRVKHIFMTFVSMLPIAVLFILSKQYIINRIFAYQEQTNGGEANYQVSQAIIGFGNGAFFGVGPGNSNQKDFFLPQSYDDFVYSIVGEEYGFIGATLVIVLLLVFIYRGLRLAKSVEDDFGRYLAFGFVVVIGLNAVINMMVATGIIPTTGVTLPFMSYGGTSIIFNSIAVGILLNISTHRESLKTSWWHKKAAEVEINDVDE
jgi:cell division protein FtsW